VLKLILMIALKDLQKVIDNKTVLDIEVFELGSGEIAAIVGPVDSGRDILFELLIGRTRPTSGSVRIADSDPYALDNLAFYVRLHRLPKSRAEEVLEQVGLGDQARTQAEKLSSSLTRRLAFGRAILHEPQVLLLEEPFAKCDEASISLLSRLIRDQADSGIAVLILSEDPDNCEDLCKMIYRMEQGHIVEAYDPSEAQTTSLPFMIPARLDDKVVLVDPGDILYIFAQDDRAHLQTIEDRLPTQFSLAELEKRLARSGFFRAHRGYLVNLQHVKEVIPYTRDSFSLRLKDPAETKVPLSKSAARELRELLGY
jgi:ABC-2 type transport system ATP-binding protein